MRIKCNLVWIVLNEFIEHIQVVWMCLKEVCFLDVVVLSLLTFGKCSSLLRLGLEHRGLWMQKQEILHGIANIKYFKFSNQCQFQSFMSHFILFNELWYFLFLFFRVSYQTKTVCTNFPPRVSVLVTKFMYHTKVYRTVGTVWEIEIDANVHFRTKNAVFYTFILFFRELLSQQRLPQLCQKTV